MPLPPTLPGNIHSILFKFKGLDFIIEQVTSRDRPFIIDHVEIAETSTHHPVQYLPLKADPMKIIWPVNQYCSFGKLALILKNLNLDIAEF